MPPAPSRAVASRLERSLHAVACRSLPSPSSSSSSSTSASSASLPSPSPLGAPLGRCRHQHTLSDSRRSGLVLSGCASPRAATRRAAAQAAVGGVSLSSSSPSPSSSSAAGFSTSAVACRDNQKRQRMRQFFALRGGMFKPGEQQRQMEAEGGDGLRRERTIDALFPLNRTYTVKPVLGERTRELVWTRVVEQGESVKAVAAELGMDMRRVAAVVRLKAIEKSWVAEGKPLAKNYAAAVMSMLPHTQYGDGDRVYEAFEPINEIHTHAYTKQQLFVPVSESRHFTREDAARAFHPTLLSADKRMPIPELVAVEKTMLRARGSGRGDAARAAAQSFAAFRRQAAAEQAALVRRDQTAAAAEQARTTTVETGRFQFRIRDIDADNVGRDGRSPHAVGWRYGVPFDDRKRGQVKIPTSVG